MGAGNGRPAFMGKPLSEDLRRRVVDAVLNGRSRRWAASHFGVSVSSAIRWVASVLATGSFSRQAMGGDRRSLRLEAQAETILAAVKACPDITIDELRARCLEPPGSPRSDGKKKDRPCERAGAGRRRRSPESVALDAAGP